MKRSCSDMLEQRTNVNCLGYGSMNGSSMFWFFFGGDKRAEDKPLYQFMSTLLVLLFVFLSPFGLKLKASSQFFVDAITFCVSNEKKIFFLSRRFDEKFSFYSID